jgi:hypothetical protein
MPFSFGANSDAQVANYVKKQYGWARYFIEQHLFIVLRLTIRSLRVAKRPPEHS